MDISKNVKRVFQKDTPPAFCAYMHKVNYLSSIFNKTVTKSFQTVTNFWMIAFYPAMLLYL